MAQQEEKKEESKKKFFLVTGSNKLDGLGFAFVVQLAKKLDLKETDVFLSGRKMDQLVIAQKEIKEKFDLDVKCLELDYSNKESQAKLVEFVKTNYNGIDGFIHNADPFPPDMVSKCEASAITNWFNISIKGTQALMESIYPLLNNGSRVVIIASAYGLIENIPSKDVQKKFANKALDLDGLNNLLEEYVKDYGDGKIENKWPGQSNAIGKLGRNCVARYYGNKAAADDNKKDVIINAGCPGWTRTGAVKGYLEQNKELDKKAKEPMDAATYIVDLVTLPADNKDNPNGRLVQYGKDLGFDVEK